MSPKGRNSMSKSGKGKHSVGRRGFLAGRIIHGSDLPVPVHGHFAWLNGTIDWATFRRWERDPNVLERDYQLKRAMGFGPETFTRLHGLLRRLKA